MFFYKTSFFFSCVGVLILAYPASAQILYIGDGISGQTVSITNDTSDYNAVYVSLNSGDSNNLLSVNNTGTLLNVSGGMTSPGELDVGVSGSGSMMISGGGVTDSNAILGVNSGSSGVVIVSNGGLWSNNASLIVGNGGSGSLMITNGTVFNYDAYIGYKSNSTGSVSVDSGTWSAGDLSLYVGYSGKGSLFISGNSLVEGAQSGLDVSSFIGYNPGSTGVVTVTGGLFTNINMNFIGYSGKGSMNITGGVVCNYSDAYIGYNSGSTGSVSVSGGVWLNGSLSSNSVTGFTISSSDLYVGNYGSGSLTISGTGSVLESALYIGNHAGSTGTVTITGGALVNTNTPDNYIGIIVGNAGTGSLTISGGTVLSGIDYIGHSNGATGTVTVSGGLWVNNYFYIGGNTELGGGPLPTEPLPYGSLTISGGTVVSSNSYIGYANAGYSNQSIGTVTVSGGLWSNAGIISIGDSGAGSLTISGSGTVTSEEAIIGDFTGSTGAVRVNGGSWSSGMTNFIGYNGSASLIIGPGGTVAGGSTFSASADSTYGLYATNSLSSIGNGSNSFGSVIVNGGLWSNSYTYYYSSFGNLGSNVQYYTLDVGNYGSGSLIITNGGTVVAGNSFIGNYAGSTGSVTVNDGTWIYNGSLIVGNGGLGNMTITNGGTITGSRLVNPNSTPIYVATLGYGSNAVGTVTVSGGSWNNENIYTYISTDLFTGIRSTNFSTNYNNTVVGGYGSGSLIITNGGTVVDGYSYLGNYSGSTGSVTVNGGSWSNSGSLYVGYGGSGSLTITNGTVYNYDSYIGYNSNSSGSVSVGSGTWTAGDVNLYVGYNGKGSLSISGGSTVEGASYLRNTNFYYDYNSFIGYNPGSTGSVSVSGGLFTNINTNFIGYSGTGTMNISAGSVWNYSDAYIGYKSNSSGSVTVSGGAWMNASPYAGFDATTLYDNVYVGNYGSGSLTISGSGTVVDAATYIANKAGSTGSVTVSGGTWTNANGGNSYAGIIVGNYGSGSLTINGGSVYSGIDYIGYANGATGTVTVSGGLWSNNYLYIGGNDQFGGGPLPIGPAPVGTLTISGGSVLSGQSYIGYADAGYTTMSFGSVTVSGGLWSNTGILRIGDSGTGNLTISGSGTVICDEAVVGDFADSTGTVTVTGGSWINPNTLTLGSSGSGSMNISGGSVSDSTAYIGFSAGSTGTVTVSGGLWSNSGNLYVDYNGGTASLSISGGTVSDVNGYINNARSGTSSVTVSGGSWMNTYLYIGDASTGYLTITESGNVTAPGGVSLGTIYTAGTATNSVGILNFGTLGGNDSVALNALVTPTISLDSTSSVINFNQSNSYTLTSSISTSIPITVLTTNVTFNGLGFQTNYSSYDTNSSTFPDGGSIYQLGSGTTILTGSNSYTGITTIARGALLLNGVNTGGGALAVNGGTLGGTGSTISSVTVGSGGSITPGNGSTPGTLSIGNLTMDAGSMLNIFLSGGISSLLAVSTNAAVGGTVNFTDLGNLTNSIYTFLTGNSVNGTFSATNGLPSDYKLVYSSNSIYLELIGNSGTNIVTNVALPVLGAAIFNGTNAVITGGSTNFTVTVSNTGSTNLLFAGNSGINVSGSIASSTLPAGSSTNVSGFSFTGTNTGTNTGSYTISAPSVGANGTNGSVQVIVYNHAEGALLTNSVTLPEEHFGYTSPITMSVGITNSNGLVVNLNALPSSTNPNLGLGSVASLPERTSTNVVLDFARGQHVGIFTNSVTVTFADASTLSGASTNVGTATLTVAGIIYSGQSYWTGNGSGNWTSFVSWDMTGGTPGLDGLLSTNDTATFDARGLASGTGIVTLNTNASLSALTFSNAAASYTIEGTGTLTLAAGSNQPIIANLAGTHTINTALDLAANATLFENQNTTLTINGTIGGTGGLIQNGNGIVILSGANSYTGGTVITSGVLRTTSHSALGSGSVVLNGGTLSIQSLLNVNLFNWNSGIVDLPKSETKQFLNVTSPVSNALKLSVGKHAFNLEGLQPVSPTELLAAVNLTSKLFSTNEFSVQNVKGKYKLFITNNALWITGISSSVGPVTNSPAAVSATNSTPIVVAASPSPTPINEAPPTLYLSLSTTAFNLANAQNGELLQRLWGVRVAGTGFSMSGFADNTPVIEGQGDGDKGVLDAKKDILRPGSDNHWGMFADANGIFAAANSGNMLPDYQSESGGITTGLTYKWNDCFGTGIYAGYEGSYNKYAALPGTASQSTLIDNSVRFGLFGTYGDPSGRGFYSDALIGGGYNNYNVNRVIPYNGMSSTATSSPGAGELDSMLAGGYDLRHGSWTYGPTTSLQYTYLGANPVNESGAQSLDFSSSSWDASSLLYSLGVHLAYSWQATRDILVVPQMSLSWQHEFLQNPYAINGSYGNGPAFATTSATPLRDTLYTGVGFTVAFGTRWNTALFYNASVGNNDLTSQNIFWSLGATF